MQLPDALQTTAPLLGPVWSKTLAGLRGNPDAVTSLAITLVVTGVLMGVDDASGVAVTPPTLMVVAGATLFAGVGSAVALPAVVRKVRTPDVAGVKVLEQLIVAPTAKVPTGEGGVQVVTSPGIAGPEFCATVHVAAVAACGPSLVQEVTKVTGTPTAVVCVAAPVARMSAPVPALLMVQVMSSNALRMVICGGLAGLNGPAGGKTVSELVLVLLQLMVLL